ncbi:MAG: response regulator [Bacteroidetes bacterium]|nr:response regulator [Bacteroidota bacterium]
MNRNYFLKVIIIPSITYFVMVGLYILFTSYSERERIITEVDHRLVIAAANIKQVLDPTFFDRATDSGTISPEEHLKNIQELSRNVKTSGLTYLYATVVRNGKVIFIASSAKDEEFLKHKLPTYWQAYPEATPEFIQTMNSSQPTFETSEDRWGKFESAIMAQTSPGGNRYLVGADMDISYINEHILSRIPYVFMRALFFLIIVGPFFYFLTKYYKKNTAVLEEKIQERKQAEKQLEDYKVHLEEMVQSRTEQLQEEVRERKLMSEELQVAKEIAVKESRAKSIFLANMSHEIRTPMNGVIGMTNILKETDLTEEQKEYLDIIDISGNNLLSIINDILDFSKIEAGQVELENIAFNLRYNLEEVVKMLHVRAEGKGLKLFLTISSDLPDLIKGDPVRLKQIVMNLANNAIKFTEEGSVSILIEPIWQNEVQMMVKCRVADTGLGISEKGREKLFKEFSQTDVSTTRKYGGTGLGLKIAYDLVRLMGGEISVESEEGKGSVFWFTAVFGKMLKSELEKLEQEKQKDDIKSIPILLVEDNYISQRVARTSLEKDGFTNLEIAENGRVAIRLFEKKEYEIILMDIRMPVMDGLEATEKIRELERLNPQRKASYIVAFTAYAVEGDKERFLEAGMDDYVAKPFQPEELVRVITKFAGKREYRKQRALSILLAEDNKINQKVAIKTLESFGHKVDLAETGVQALEKFKNNNYNIILMDVEMPEMDGLEATQMIRKIEREDVLKGVPKGRIKIVALTASTTKEDREKCIASGMDDYISKPFRQSELVRALNI